jgi:hypothetical protein
VSLRRTRADWPIVAAAWVVTLLASVLLAAGPIYADSASEAGLRRTLADASVVDANVQVSIYVDPADAARVDDRAHGELRFAIAPLGGAIVRDWRASATLALPLRDGADAGDQGVLGFLDGLPDHAKLVGGAWPEDGTGPSEPLQVVVVDSVATALHLAVGDELRLVAHPSTQPLPVPVRLVGIIAVDAPDDPYWNDDQQLVTGIRENGQYRTFGPFLTTRDGLLRNAADATLHLQWRTFADYDGITVDSASELRRRVDGLPGRLEVDIAESFYVATGLPDILAAAERSLLVSRTGVLLLMGQLAILAGYAIILTASLLVDHRRVDTALLRSRGAGPVQVAMLALEEGLLLAVPAVLVAPWLAVAALNLLNVVGPLADVGLHISPHVSADGYLAAGAAGIVCVALLVLPAALAARAFAAEQSGRSRQETRTFGQRMGLDIALVAVTAIALWQLRLYGAPLTRTVQGTLGLDPLLVAAPAIGFLAGGVLALRILPILAAAAASAVARGSDLVVSLGSRQLARRPLRYTRSALLLMLAMSMGVFALSYSATWSTSQHDQAQYQAGADVRVEPGGARGTLPDWALPHAYAGLAGVERAVPVERIPSGVSFAASGSADLLALDADAAPGVLLVRSDELPGTAADLFAPLRARRPDPRFVTLPDGAAYLRIVPRLDIASIGYFVWDEETGIGKLVPIDPSTLTDLRASVSAVVRDAHGVLYRIDATPVVLTGPATDIVLALEPPSAGGTDGASQAAARMDGPLELAAVSLTVWLPMDTETTDAVVGVAGVSVGTDPAGPWSEVALESAGGWSAGLGQGRTLPVVATSGPATGLAVHFIADEEQQDVLFGNGTSFPATQLSFLPASVHAAFLGRAVPAIANRALLDATSSKSGETISTTLEGLVRTVDVVGVVDRFPTTDPEQPLLIIDEPTLGLLRLESMTSPRPADEWWMAVADGGEDGVSAALRASPFASASVVTAVDRIRGLTSDPVALGIIGALTIGFVATGLFAIIGLTVSAAVTARQRRTEFALLRALGLSGRQLAGSLWLENGSVVAVSLVAGTSLGLLIGWMVLPFVTVTQGGTTPIPPVLLQLPWDRILLLDAASAVALGVAVVVIGGVLRRLGVGSVLRMGED